MGSIINQLPEPPSLVINNIYSEDYLISVLYNDLSTLTVFSSVNLIFESHMQVLTSYTFDGSELNFKLDGTELSFSDYLRAISLKDESQKIIKIDLEPKLISYGSMIDITINLLYELVKQNKLYNFLDENYYSNNISLIKTWLNDNLTHVEVGNADVIDRVISNYVPVIRKPVIKTTIEDSVICEAFFDTDEINGTYTAVRYFINGTDTIGTGNIAFTVITSITKNETDDDMYLYVTSAAGIKSTQLLTYVDNVLTMTWVADYFLYNRGNLTPFKNVSVSISNSSTIASTCTVTYIVNEIEPSGYVVSDSIALDYHKKVAYMPF